MMYPTKSACKRLLHSGGAVALGLTMNGIRWMIFLVLSTTRDLMAISLLEDASRFLIHLDMGNVHFI